MFYKQKHNKKFKLQGHVTKNIWSARMQHNTAMYALNVYREAVELKAGSLLFASKSPVVSA